jgi:Galactose oxidase, central domain/Kelch motif
MRRPVFQLRLLLSALFGLAFVLHASAPRFPARGSLTAGPHMLEPRSGHSATLLPDGRVLIAGGMRRNRDFYKSAELYSPATGKFERSGEMSIARVGQAAVLLPSGKVLIAGGWVGDGCTDSAELYDPATGQFSVIGKMTTRRGRPSATLLADGDVLITGGADHDSPGGISSAELFRSATFSFQAIEPMHYARIAHTATLLKDGRVLIVGGRGETLAAAAELYDPKTRKFSETGRLITARYKHTAGLLPDGRVLIAGGSDEHDWNGKLSSVEIFDPAMGKFSAAVTMNDARFKLPETSVLLNSGELIIAGGSRDVEIFNPISGKFKVVPGQMHDIRHYMSETKLIDGSVLLAGGYPNSDFSTGETWMFRP